ncbi:hypothetical protein INR49_006543 [Caranx melampygus]|nr:hypothetical protein INR49_006543 [Caranx melampygus]
MYNVKLYSPFRHVPFLSLSISTSNCWCCDVKQPQENGSCVYLSSPFIVSKSSEEQEVRQAEAVDRLEHSGLIPA